MSDTSHTAAVSTESHLGKTIIVLDLVPTADDDHDVVSTILTPDEATALMIALGEACLAVLRDEG